jgi:hypothetical protein
MLLSAVEAEIVARHGIEVNTVQSILFAPHLNPKKIKQMAAAVDREIMRLHCISVFDLPGAKKFAAKGSLDALAKLYQSLEKSQFFDMIREEHFNINPGERDGRL